MVSNIASPQRTLPEWLRYIETLHPRSIDLSLERVQAVLERMALRRPPFAVVTIGGTNGKGSTVTMYDAILRAARVRVGSYTSPHLVRYNERVRVQGQMAGDDELCRAFERIERLRGDVALTYFEYGTIAALEIFRNHAIDIALLEIGLGGRLDAVNAVDPDVAIVTSIGIDHTNWLGVDRESIGREKAGIFRAARPAICGEAEPPATLTQYAASIGAKLYCYGRDFTISPTAGGWSLQFGSRTRSGLPYPALRGQYQLRNAACALAAIELLAERFPVAQSQIREGLISAFVAGRFQVMPGTPPTILDVAHNAQAAEALAANLRAHRIAGRTHAVFGMLIDKAIADVARALKDQVDCWYTASIQGPRGASAAEVARALADANVNAPVSQHERIVDAYEAARRCVAPADRIVVFGSFYTVGDILAHLNAAPT